MTTPVITRIGTQFERDELAHRKFHAALAFGTWAACLVLAGVLLAVIP